MDSCNSGSLQSSSGGEEEYDSRSAADSFIITSHVSGLPISPPSFDPISSYMQFSQNPSPLFLNANTAWPAPGPESLRSDPIRGTSHGFNNHPLLSGSPVFQTPATTVGADAATASQNPPRNQRKRSRASRRAPTTVLTTDTTNFRAMVQEFTGIPAPQFANLSLPRNQFDLFGGRSAILDPPYFRRPFSQKPQSPPPTFPATNNLFNFPNPLLNSLLQSNPKFFPPKTNHQDSFEIPSKIDGPDQFGLSSGSYVDPPLTGLPHLISSDQIGAAPKNPDHSDSGGYGFPTGKADLPASEKGSDNIGGRSEGMVESWICSE